MDPNKPFTAAEIAYRVAIQILTAPVPAAVILLLASWARTHHFGRLWTGFWIFEINAVLYMICTPLWMLDRPKLYRERIDQRKQSHKRESVPPQEGLYFLGLLLLSVMGLMVAGWDGVSQSLSLQVNVVGTALFWLGGSLINYVMRINQYAFTHVCRQEGQQGICTTGPYAIVRHPFYTGMILAFPGMALSLGSYWALVPFGTLIPLTFWRTYHEEEFLVGEFRSTYREYRRKTKYKIIPFIF